MVERYYNYLVIKLFAYHDNKLKKPEHNMPGFFINKISVIYFSITVMIASPTSCPAAFLKSKPSNKAIVWASCLW